MTWSFDEGTHCTYSTHGNADQFLVSTSFFFQVYIYIRDSLKRDRESLRTSVLAGQAFLC